MNNRRSSESQADAGESVKKGEAPLRQIRIDFLYLDLTTCTRCLDTDKNLEVALQTVAEVLTATGMEVKVNRILIESADQARALGFVSSPTIRVNGRDIALEMRESRCESCGTCASGENVACRVWVYRGVEYTEAPVGMIVEAILREVYAGPRPALPDSIPLDELPENLSRFFIGKAEKKVAHRATCCPLDEEASCCEASEKAVCCPTTGAGSCGCR